MIGILFSFSLSHIFMYACDTFKHVECMCLSFLYIFSDIYFIASQKIVVIAFTSTIYAWIFRLCVTVNQYPYLIHSIVFKMYIYLLISSIQFEARECGFWFDFIVIIVNYSSEIIELFVWGWYLCVNEERRFIWSTI